MISTIIGCIALFGFIACQFILHTSIIERHAGAIERSPKWSISSAIYLLIAAICFK